MIWLYGKIAKWALKRHYACLKKLGRHPREDVRGAAHIALDRVFDEGWKP